jgi:hypothetical protein
VKHIHGAGLGIQGGELVARVPPGWRASRDQRVKSTSEAKAREHTTSKPCPDSALRLSTRACRPVRFGSLSVAAACWMKAAFLATVSTQVTEICGQAMAITTPGRPPPEPTSSKCSGRSPTCRRKGPITARLSSRWWVIISAGSRTAVRL